MPLRVPFTLINALPFVLAIVMSIMPISAAHASGSNEFLLDFGSSAPVVLETNGAAITHGEYVGSAMPQGWHIVGDGDFFGTGSTDLLWTVKTGFGPLYMWQFTPSGPVGISLAQYGVVPGIPWVGDFNADGKSDILWDTNGHAPLLWTMNGATLANVQFFGLPMPPGWHIAGTGDFAGNGYSDVLWTTGASPGPAVLWSVGAAGPVSVSLAQYGRISGKAWIADFNGDGKQDILWDNGTAPPLLWTMNGASVTGERLAGTAMPAGYHIAAVGDLGGNNYSDILWTTANSSGPAYLWVNTGSGFASLSLGLYGNFPSKAWIGNFFHSNSSATDQTSVSPVNGLCGSANSLTAAIAPSTNLCGTGTASVVSGTGPWIWSCAGNSSGTSAQCSAPLTAINGQCGSANGISAASAPSANLCNAGAASAVGGTGPWTWSCSGNASGATAQCAANPIQVPGPSPALFNNPYYTCTHNYYVSATGSDMNNGTSPITPWLTLRHANDAGRTGGDCVNVAPGTYSGVSLTHGGTSASASGYITYRCTTMDACRVNSNAQVGSSLGTAAFSSAGTNTANYIMIDGFELLGTNAVYQLGADFTGSTNGGNAAGSHHDWILNSIIHNNGQSGIAFANGDYTYALHNLVYDNSSAASCDNGAQGSGIADNVPQDINYFDAGYMPTADDKTNPNPMIGSFVTGASWFHKSYSWNVAYNNYIAPCSGSTTSDTDGNNIILDTFNTGNGNVVNYPDQTLIAFNVVYNAGGTGIHIFYSEYATVANNTCYNNGLDPDNQGADRACIDTNDSYSNILFNNIAVALPVTPTGPCTFNQVPYAQFNNATLGGPLSGNPADTWTNNITQLQGGFNSCWGQFGVDAPTGENTSFGNDIYSCITNKCATDPKWVSVGTSSTGSETTPPTGTNFALKPGSPAIGAGTTATYLSGQSIDIGACSSALTSCP